MSSIFQQVYQAQAQFTRVLMTLPNVVGVAVGYRESSGEVTDEPAVAVLVRQKKPLAALSADERVPPDLDGIRTDVYEVGFLEAQQAINPKGRIRPTIPGGVSIGHFKVTAGTLGAVVRDRTTGERLLLSNNHVLANSNEANIGDAILQPGATDSGKNPEDMVAKLERFITLNYLEGPIKPPKPSPGDPPDGTPPRPTPSPDGNGCNVFVEALMGLAKLFGGARDPNLRGSASSVGSDEAVGDSGRLVGFGAQAASAQNVPDNVADCALARPVDTTMFTDQINEIGVVRDVGSPALGMLVRKSGRTTGLTTATITLLNATVDVNYNTSAGSRTARFTGQVITGSMSQGGDSGSLVVDAAANRAVGLLFAGSQLATIFTPIDTVMTALNIEFGL